MKLLSLSGGLHAFPLEFLTRSWPPTAAKREARRGDDAALEKIRLEVAELANQFPLYAWRRGL